MDKPDKDISRLSPDALLGDFTGGSIGKWLLIALVLHLGVVGLTSVSRILDMVDPGRVEAREALAAQKAEEEKAAVTPPAAAASPDEVEQAARTEESTSETTEAADEGREPTPVEKRVTETAKPDELPDQPDLKISDEEFGL